MRKLTSKEEERKKQKRNQIIVGIILIGVLVMSVFGIFVNSFGQNNSGSTGGTVEYNGYDFVNQDNLWYTQVGENQFAFSKNPFEINRLVENSSLEIQGKINELGSYSGKPLYVYSQNYEARLEILRNMNERVLRAQNACPGGNITQEYPELGNLDCESEWPIKSCDENFIILKTYENESSGNKDPKIIQEDNCLIVLGKSEDITKLTDYSIFKIAGIE